MEKLVLENWYKIVMPLFGAAFAAPNKGITILSDFDHYHQWQFLQKIEEFKDFSRLLCNFPVLFKAYFIFKDFSRKPSKFKYFSSLCEPCVCSSNFQDFFSERAVPNVCLFKL